jgi:heme exporter protein D
MIDIAMVFMVVMWGKKEILKNIYKKKKRNFKKYLKWCFVKKKV